MKVDVVEDPRFGGANMQAVTTIGLDIAKSVFQVHGTDAKGQVIIRRQLAALRLDVLSEAGALPHWDRGLRWIASLVAPTAGPGTYGYG
jgi:hypothetical protein